MLPSRRAIARENRRRSRLISQTDMLPVATLSAFFLFVMMVQTQPYHHSQVDMFKATNAHNEPGAHREDAMIITVARDGRAYFDSRQIGLWDVPQRIRASIQSGSERKVYLRPDTRARTVDVNAVLDAIQRSGVTNVAILTEKLDPPAQP